MAQESGSVGLHAHTDFSLYLNLIITPTAIVEMLLLVFSLFLSNCVIILFFSCTLNWSVLKQVQSQSNLAHVLMEYVSYVFFKHLNLSF